MIDADLQESKTKELLDILKELERPSLTMHDLDKLGEKLKKVYLSDAGEPYRHSYSGITNYMYMNHVIDKVPTIDPGTIIQDHLKFIAEGWEADPDLENKDLLCNAIRKLIDHISLEVVRLGQMANIYYRLTQTDELKEKTESLMIGIKEAADILKEQKQEAERVGEEIAKSENEVKEIRLEVKNHNTQSITVLSIFSCVVFAFTGGFSLIAGALNILPNITKTNSLLLIAILLMLSLLLADTVYILLRAARHYSSATQGHLTGFYIVNFALACLFLFIILMYLFPSWFPFLPVLSETTCTTMTQ